MIGITFEKIELPPLPTCHGEGILMENFNDDTYILKDVPDFLNAFPTKIIKEVIKLKIKKCLDADSLASTWTNNHNEFSWPVIQKMQRSATSSPFIRSLSKKDLAELFI